LANLASINTLRLRSVQRKLTSTGSAHRSVSHFQISKLAD